MSDLYTKFMEWIMPFLQANWQITIIVAGALFLIHATPEITIYENAAQAAKFINDQGGNYNGIIQ